MARGVIGIDLGGTKIAAALFNQRGQIARQLSAPLEGRRGRAVGRLITRQLLSLLEFARSKNTAVYAVGVSVPGISDAKKGTVWAPNIPGWQRYPLRREIRSVLGDRTIPVVIGNDRAAHVVGESWRGAAKGCRNVIFLAVGTGIGAGILIDSKVLRGAHDIAGSIGWLALNRPFRPQYKSCGCFEYHASGEGLARVAKEMLRRPAGPNASTLRRFDAITAPALFAACEKNDPLATIVIAQAVEFWGMAVANLVSLFNPEKIIFGGGVFGPATRFLRAIHAEAKKWAQPIAIKKVKLESSKLGGLAGLYGAACFALRAGSSEAQGCKSSR